MSAFIVEADSEGVLWLSGELDLAAVGRFVEIAKGAVNGHRSVTLDLSRLSFLDSAGIRAFLSLAADAPGGVVLRHPRASVRRALTITGLVDRAEIRVQD